MQPWSLPPREKGSNTERCDRAPAGWKCIRQPHHDGPCAAVEDRNLAQRIKAAGQAALRELGS